MEIGTVCHKSVFYSSGWSWSLALVVLSKSEAFLWMQEREVYSCVLRRGGSEPWGESTPRHHNPQARCSTDSGHPSHSQTLQVRYSTGKMDWYASLALLLYTWQPVFRIRIHWVRIQPFRLNTELDPDPVFWWPKIWKIFSWKKIHIFLTKSCNLSLGLHKGRLIYRGSLQPSKENIQHFKTWPDWIWIQFGSGSETLLKTT